MRNICLAILLSLMPFVSRAQVKRTSIPLGDAIRKALDKSILTDGDSRPFHIHITVSEPENPQSPYQGAIEEWWVSKDQWRREVRDKGGLHQTIVVAGGKYTEKDEGDYFPRWLRSFVTAAFEPLPGNAAAVFAATGATIDQITLPNGDVSDACARFKSQIGTGLNAIDFFSNVCFDAKGRLKFYGSIGYDMEFHDYRSFGKKQVARELSDDPESGTHLVGKVDVLEEAKAPRADLFTPLPTIDDRFRSVTVSTEQLKKILADIPPVAWPEVRSGKTSGNLSIYISLDSQGKVREAWPLTGDNGELHDFLREQARTWQTKPVVGSSGENVQVEGSISYHFESRIGKPLPVVSGTDVQKQLVNCPYNPTLPAGLLPSGTKFTIHIAVDENGSETGISFPGGIDWKIFEATGLTGPPSVLKCRFKPFLEEGKPTYYFMNFDFVAP